MNNWTFWMRGREEGGGQGDPIYKFQSQLILVNI